MLSETWSTRLERCLGALRLVVAAGLLLCLSGLPAGGLQIFAWLHMAGKAGGLSQLEQVIVAAPPCDLCLLSRQLANDPPDERRDSRERTLPKIDPATALARHDGWRQRDGAVGDLRTAWERCADLCVPPGPSTRPPTPPPQPDRGPAHA